MPTYSIIIPTVDRPTLLENTVRAFLSNPHKNLEVLVSDNFSGPETRAAIEPFLGDDRFRHIRTERRLAVSDHWDFAWKHVRGDYVIMNCDDDLASPLCLKALNEVLARFSPDLVSWHTGLFYHADFDLHGNPCTLFMDIGHSNQALVLNTREVVERFAQFDWRVFPFGTNYCLSKALGDRIAQQTGRLFWPPYPDFSSSLLALANVRPGGYLYLDALLGYGGRSINSVAAGFCKEKNRAGDSKRARTLFEEFGQQDKYPHHGLKIPVSLNGQAAAFSVLKTLYPKFADGIEFNLEMLFDYVYRELYGLNLNPLVDRSMESHVDAYVATLSAEQQSAVRRARERVLASMPASDPPPWWRRARGFLASLTGRKISPPAPAACASVPTVGSKFEAPGKAYGFHDGYTLALNWERVVSQLDIVSPCRVNGIAELNLLHGAYPLECLAHFGQNAASHST